MVILNKNTLVNITYYTISISYNITPNKWGKLVLMGRNIIKKHKKTIT